MSVNLGTAYADIKVNSQGFIAGMAEAQASLQKFKTQAGLIGSSMSKLGSSLTRTVTMPIVGLGTAAVKTGMDFDAAMSQVAAISGATGEELDELTAKAREMGSKTKFSATESAEAMNYMAMAGWKTEEMLDGLEGIMNLAAASGEDLATTSDIVTDALTAFGLSAKDSSHFADVLAASAANSNTNVGMLGESFKYIAPVAGAMGYSVEDVAVALGLMANNGIKASMGGTALRNILTNLAKPTDQVSMAMDELGISLQDDAGNMKSLNELMEDLRKAFGKTNISVEEYEEELNSLNELHENGTLTTSKYEKEIERLNMRCFDNADANKAMYAATIAGKHGMSGLLAIVNSSEEDFVKLNDAIYSASDGMGMAASQASIMIDNFKGQLTILKSALQELGIQIYKAILPSLKEFISKVQKLVEWFSNLSVEQKQQVMKWAAIAAAIGPVLKLLGSLITTISKLSGATSSLFSFVVAHPVFAIIAAAVAACTYAVYESVKANKEYYDSIASLSEEEQALKEATEQYIDKVNQRVDSNLSLIDSIRSEYQENEALIEELQQITDAEGKVKEGYEERAQVITEQLAAAFGIEIEYQDGVIAKYQEVMNSLDQIIAKKQAESLLSANVDAYNEAMREQVEVYGRLSDAQKAYESAQEGVKKAREGVANAEKTLADRTMDTVDNIWIYQDAVTQANIALQASKDKEAELKTILDEARDAYSLNQSTIENYVALQKTLASGSGDLDTAITNLTYNIRTSSSTSIDILQKQADQAKKTYEDMKQAMESGEIKVSETLLAEAKRNYEETQKILQDAVTLADTEGENFIDGWVSHIQDTKAAEAARKMVEDSILAVQDAQDSHSPSRIMADEGLNFVDGFYNGIFDNFGKIIDTLKAQFDLILTNVKDWGVTMITESTTTAKNFVTGFINLIKTLPADVYKWISQIPNKISSISGQMSSAGSGIFNSLWGGMKSVWSSIWNWMSGVGDQIAKFFGKLKEKLLALLAMLPGGDDEDDDGSHAGGLAYVPYNGYRAQLHEGERVLTRNQAEAYNNGGSGNYTFNYYSPTAIDPYQANRLFKQSVREMEEGFA